MKPEEYKAFRKMESEIITYIERLESILSTDSDHESEQKALRFVLEENIEEILGYALTESDLQGLQLMIDDELKDGTIDFGNLEKYKGLYREQNVGEADVSGDICKGKTPDKKTAVGKENAVEIIKAQLAEISIMEHKLSEMKRELFRLYDDLGSHNY